MAIAKVLAQEPEVILADEPVSSLDVMNVALVMATLQCIASSAGLTVIASLHHVDYARRYADRIPGLCAGRLVCDRPPEALNEVVIRNIFGDVPPDAAGLGPMAAEVVWLCSCIGAWDGGLVRACDAYPSLPVLPSPGDRPGTPTRSHLAANLRGRLAVPALAATSLQALCQCSM